VDKIISSKIHIPMDRIVTVFSRPQEALEYKTHPDFRRKILIKNALPSD
jgi:hypothetical protein